jgi:hypothetical protein
MPSCTKVVFEPQTRHQGFTRYRASSDLKTVPETWFILIC